MIGNDSKGKTVLVKLDGRWVQCQVVQYVGGGGEKPERDLVEVFSPLLGHETFMAGDLHLVIPGE